jgi:CHASE2 domain-containing sensor protein
MKMNPNNQNNKNMKNDQLVVTENGSLAGIEKVSERKQKAIITSEIASNANEIVKLAEQVEQAKIKMRELKAFLRKSKEWKEAVNLKAAIKDAQKRGELLSVERSGMLRLAKKLGFDIEEEIRNIKKISQ